MKGAKHADSDLGTTRKAHRAYIYAFISLPYVLYVLTRKAHQVERLIMFCSPFTIIYLYIGRGEDTPAILFRFYYYVFPYGYIYQVTIAQEKPRTNDGPFEPMKRPNNNLTI